jgi:hypothetical protein
MYVGGTHTSLPRHSSQVWAMHTLYLDSAMTNVDLRTFDCGRRDSGFKLKEK